MLLSRANQLGDGDRIAAACLPVGGLRGCVDRLRGVLGERLVAERGGYRIRLGVDELDICQFHSLAASARRHAQRGALAEAADGYEAALACWAGPPFADLDEPLRQRVGADILSGERYAALLEYAGVATRAG